MFTKNKFNKIIILTIFLSTLNSCYDPSPSTYNRPLDDKYYYGFPYTKPFVTTGEQQQNYKPQTEPGTTYRNQTGEGYYTQKQPYYGYN